MNKLLLTINKRYKVYMDFVKYLCDIIFHEILSDVFSNAVWWIKFFRIINFVIIPVPDDDVAHGRASISKHF